MPTFERVTINELDQHTNDWLVHVLTTIETLDVDAYVELMTEDVVLRLQEGTELHGRAEVAVALKSAWAGLSRIEHQEENIWGDSRQVVHEARIEIDTVDGHTIVSHGTSWINRTAEGLISSARVYS